MQIFVIFVIAVNLLVGLIASADSLLSMLRGERDRASAKATEGTAYLAFALAAMALFPHPGVTP